MGRLNKPAQEGLRYRSPNQTNAADKLPNLREDVGASQRADLERMRKGLNTADVKNAANRARSQEAAGRAMTRSLGRASAGLGALQAGYGIGRGIDEATGIGRKLVDAIGGKAIDQMVAGGMGERVQLSPEAKARIAAGELDEKPAPKAAPKPAAKPAAKPSPKRESAPTPEGSVREGSNAGIGDDVRARAMAAMRERYGEKEPETYAKGGKVRGWGAARGGKKFKVY